MPIDEETEPTNEDEAWSIDDILPEDDPVVEDEEKNLDKVLQNQTKAIRKVAERQAKAERQAEVERMTTEFYTGADDTAKEFADVLLAGVTEPDKVKRMLDLASAKAAKLNGEPEPEVEESTEDADAFAPPVGNAPPRVKDPMSEMAQATKDGVPGAAFREFLTMTGGLPGEKKK